MPSARVNGVELHYELSGSGVPLALVHGSWGDHHNWDPVVLALSASFQVLAYDRRGHSRSERPAGQGTVFEDADDLVALIEKLDLAPAHVVGSSFGTAIVLRAAVRRPDIFRSLIGQAGARLFVETIAFGPGAWDRQLTPDMRRVMVSNAPTWLDETRNPDALEADLAGLASFDRPALLTNGAESAPFFGPVVDIVAERLPQAERITIEGAGHVPHLSVPERYVQLVTTFAGTGRTRPEA